MPQLNLEKEYQSGSNASIGVSGHEPNGDFWTYRVNAIDVINNSMAKPDASVFYPFVKPDTTKAPAIALTPVDNIGVKKFVGWGSGAFYHPIDSEYSYLVLPIHKKLNEQEAPIVEITNHGNVVIFDVSQNGKIVYETVRLIVQKGNLRDEKVIYFDKSGVIHYEMVTAFTGAATASVRAHANEINVISELTEVELDMGSTLISALSIKEKSAPLFNYDPDAIEFTDDRGMSIENISIARSVDGEYNTEGDDAIVKMIPIPDRSTYGDDYVVDVSEV